MQEIVVSWNTGSKFSLKEYPGLRYGDGMKDRLRRVIAGRKPFRNFKAAVGNSGYRQRRFDFKQEGWSGSSWSS